MFLNGKNYALLDCQAIWFKQLWFSEFMVWLNKSMNMTGWWFHWLIGCCKQLIGWLDDSHTHMSLVQWFNTYNTMMHLCNMYIYMYIYIYHEHVSLFGWLALIILYRSKHIMDNISWQYYSAFLDAYSKMGKQCYIYIVYIYCILPSGKLT
jgi:hypothetical protein